MNRFFGSKKEPQPVPLSKPQEPENKAPPPDLSAHSAKVFSSFSLRDPKSISLKSESKKSMATLPLSTKISKNNIPS